MLGTLLTQHGQARCPTWAHFAVSFLPNIFNYEKEQYGGENRLNGIMMLPDSDDIRQLRDVDIVEVNGIEGHVKFSPVAEQHLLIFITFAE